MHADPDKIKLQPENDTNDSEDERSLDITGEDDSSE
jgi:hypothetical protein